jgi:hypothetical protein
MIRSVSAGQLINFRDVEISESLALHVWLEIKRKAEKHVRSIMRAVEKVRQKETYFEKIRYLRTHPVAVRSYLRW